MLATWFITHPFSSFSTFVYAHDVPGAAVDLRSKDKTPARVEGDGQP